MPLLPAIMPDRNGWKISSIWEGSTPGPWSLTVMRTRRACARADSVTAARLGLCRAAFSSRLVMT